MIKIISMFAISISLLHAAASSSSEPASSYTPPKELYFLIEEAKTGVIGAKVVFFDRIYQGLVPHELVDGKFLLKLVKGRDPLSWSLQETFAICFHVPFESISPDQKSALRAAIEHKAGNGNADYISIKGIFLHKMGEEGYMHYLEAGHNKQSPVASYYFSTICETKPAVNGRLQPTIISFYRNASTLRKDVQIEFGKHHLDKLITGQIEFEEGKKHFRESAEAGCYLGYYQLTQFCDLLDQLSNHVKAAAQGYTPSKHALESWVTLKPALDLYAPNLSVKKRVAIDDMRKSLLSLRDFSTKEYKLGGYNFPELTTMAKSVNGYLHFLDQLQDPTVLLSCVQCRDGQMSESLITTYNGISYFTMDHDEAVRLKTLPTFDCLLSLKTQLDEMQALVTVLMATEEQKRANVVRGMLTAFYLTNHRLKSWVEVLWNNEYPDLFLRGSQAFLKVAFKEIDKHLVFVQTAERRLYDLIQKTAPYRNDRFKRAIWQ